MKKIPILFALAAALGIFAYALDWPVSDVVLTATFGENREDHFHNGIDLAGSLQTVTAVDAGEIIFWHEEQANPYALPAGIGSFLVLEHADGIDSVYCHLEPDSIVKDRSSFGRGDPVGMMGESGYSEGSHLHLTVFSREQGLVINPQVFLPRIVDTTTPVVASVSLRIGDRLVPVAEDMEVRAGTATVTAEIYDTGASNGETIRLAPYLIRFYRNGSVAREIRLESLRAYSRDVTLTQPEGSAFPDTYAGAWIYNLGEWALSPGNARLEILVRDYAGNETTAVYTFRVVS